MNGLRTEMDGDAMIACGKKRQLNRTDEDGHSTNSEKNRQRKSAFLNCIQVPHSLLTEPCRVGNFNRESARPTLASVKSSRRFPLGPKTETLCLAENAYSLLDIGAGM